MDDFGNTIILTANWDLPVAQQIQLTLNRSDNKFRASDGGDGYLSQLGYDRVRRPETEPEIEDHLLGSMLVRQVPYGAKWQMRGQLQLLKKAELQKAEDIVEVQNKGKLTLLRDQIIPFAEAAPRTRTIGATYNNPFPNPAMVYYYSDFLVWLTLSNRSLFDCENYEIDFLAVERDQPIPP
jgi:hypothetical protein